MIILGGKLNYDAPKRFKSANESVISLAGEFPKCKGLYPDCPDEPSLMDSMCRTCPKTEGMKKPKLVSDEEEAIQEKKEQEQLESEEKNKETTEEKKSVVEQENTVSTESVAQEDSESKENN